MSTEPVKAWAETVSIPTYRIGSPDKNPMFLEKRVYQGSSGAVYPYPVIDCVFGEKEDKDYTALFLENRYLKIMILPAIGGRVQMALDKTNGYHFVYYNRVIKPALVGLTGPWISGGIEFNWPQHHRPSTFEPMDWRIVENADGSKTVWCSEVERMFFTKGMHGFTLHPDRAYLQIDAQLHNRTSEPQTFLWWANPAVHVNDDYQSVFPPDVHAVMDHGKRDVSDFPIATGTYYKVNYAPGTDISRYKNIPVPTSFMADHSDFDFIGDYDHGKQAGMMHVADHHTVPGKKQWTWGTSDFGQAWDRQLTDEDGPYIELMCGAYTDNQPDFSWIMPGEEKRFTQIFMPYKGIGGAKNANKDAVINLEIADNHATFGVYVSSPRKVQVTLAAGKGELYHHVASLSPENVLIDEVALPAGTAPQQVTLRVCDADSGDELISFRPLPDETPAIPSPATPAKSPVEIATNEELFLNGLHLEQYRHATYAPEPYYEEALRRDPFDSRCNNALGLLLYRRGKFAAAEPYFRKAIAGLTRRNPNPYDGEPLYNLGLSLKMQGRYREAFDAFFKATWNAAWQDAAYFEVARLASRFGETERALELADRALRRNWMHHKARHLKITLLKKLNRAEQAQADCAIALELDCMEPGALWECDQLDESYKMPEPFIELGIDLMHAGLFDNAAALFRRAMAIAADPMAAYFHAACLLQKGDRDAALAAFKEAAELPAGTCFPHRLESVLVLEGAMRINPSDARAPYYLGNFWYAHRQYDDAIACWEKAVKLDPSFPTAHRNLGLAYFNKRNDAGKSRKALEKAFALDTTDARVFFELDQLNKRLNASPRKRLAMLDKHIDLVEQRDDLTIERITLLNALGRHDEALAEVMRRRFHPWEGGEGKPSSQFVLSLVQGAKQAIKHRKFTDAIALLEQAQTRPHNLGEGKLHGIQENDIFYFLGVAHAGLGDKECAKAFWTKASTGLSEPTSAMFYNDQPPDMIFYQGLARQALGRKGEAKAIFRKLVNYGKQHMKDDVKIDYFAVSLPDFLVFEDDLNARNRAHCHYMMALGYLGLGDAGQAQQHFDEVLTLNAAHLGAIVHRKEAS
jgi:tetratricopeptide (TPR) repeat protein